MARGLSGSLQPRRSADASDVGQGVRERSWWRRSLRLPQVAIEHQRAQAFAWDLPDAEIRLLGGGHFLLETALDEVAALMQDFLTKHADRG